MKRYLTLIFFILSIAVIVFGLRIDVLWNGIATWGIVLVLLLFAAYFTKYIPDKKRKESEKNNNCL